MSRSRQRLTPGLALQIVAAVRAGSYPQVAAQAFGVAPEVLKRWLERGNGAAAREPYRAFAGDVAAAFAQARLRAEMTVLAEAPRIWLEHGPGRESATLPGWTLAIRPQSPGQAAPSALGDPAFQKALEGMLAEPQLPRDQLDVVITRHLCPGRVLRRAA